MEFSARVRYGEQQCKGTLIVVKGDGPSLLGRDWLQDVKIDWYKIGQVSVKTVGCDWKGLMVKYAKVFRNEMGCIHPFKAKLILKEEVHPVFFHPRSVPFAIKGAIKAELDQLEKSGVIRKVDYSDWATPVVLVVKTGNKVCLCGDFKVTLNPVLVVDQYPLPKPEDLFATLAGGKVFTKLDRTNAYQQLPLEEEPQKLCTINTHHGLYQFTRMPFGVASAPAVFQKLMDNILQGLQRVVCYMDDILVTGRDDRDHLNNLEEVLKRLEQHGITVRKDKCMFMSPSVDFLGH